MDPDSLSPQENLYRLALGLCKGMDAGAAVRLKALGLTPESIFSMSSHELGSRTGMAIPAILDSEARKKALETARREMDFIGRHDIRTLLAGDAEYPSRLASCPGAPALLFKLGHADLNAAHAAAVVGTRSPSPYGLDFCDKAIRTLADSDRKSIIVSGLAFGIDAAAHAAALRYGLPTVAVVAHGLDTVYPASHRDLAASIIAAGGAVITEFPSRTAPYRPRFLQRNRIVAGISDLTLVVESGLKGGALSTARHARQYGRDTAALPGRISDPCSAGCNHLIASGKARMITSAGSLAEMLGIRSRTDAVQKTIVPELPEDQSVVFSILRSAGAPLTPDEILPRVGLTLTMLLPLLNEMEMDGILVRHPGNRFEAAI